MLCQDGYGAILTPSGGGAEEAHCSPHIQSAHEWCRHFRSVRRLLPIHTQNGEVVAEGFFWLLDVSITNSFVLYKETEESPKSHMAYRRSIVEALATRYISSAPPRQFGHTEGGPILTQVIRSD